MSTCVCDYEPSYPYRSQMRKAAKAHKCEECRHQIAVGERYEYVTGKCDGSWFDCYTCAQCIALREYVAAHVPCFCWAHGNLHEDAKATIEEYAPKCPGLFMGFGRLLVGQRARRARERGERNA